MLSLRRIGRTVSFIGWFAFIIARPATASTTEDFVPDRVPPRALGVWQQTGGGMFLVISNQGADFYHATTLVCYKDEPSSGKPLASSYARGRLENDKLVLFRDNLGDRFDQFFSREEFVRAPALPPNAVHQPREDSRFQQPEFVFELVCHHFAEQFGFFQQRHFDWAERYRRFRPRVTATTTDEELYQTFTAMLTGLGDSHTRVYWDHKKEPFRSGQAKVLDYLDALFAQQTVFKERGHFRGDWLSKQKLAVESEFGGGSFSAASAR